MTFFGKFVANFILNKLALAKDILQRYLSICMNVCLYRRILLTADPIWFSFTVKIPIGPEIVLLNRVAYHRSWGG
jgi:hypothetical protein